MKETPQKNMSGWQQYVYDIDLVGGGSSYGHITPMR